MKRNIMSDKRNVEQKKEEIENDSNRYMKQ